MTWQKSLEARGGGEGWREMADHWLQCMRSMVLVPSCAAQLEAGGKGWDAQTVVREQVAVASLMLGLGELL